MNPFRHQQQASARIGRNRLQTERIRATSRDVAELRGRRMVEPGTRRGDRCGRPAWNRKLGFESLSRSSKVPKVVYAPLPHPREQMTISARPGWRLLTACSGARVWGLRARRQSGQCIQQPRDGVRPRAMHSSRPAARAATSGTGHTPRRTRSSPSRRPRHAKVRAPSADRRCPSPASPCARPP